MIAAEGIPEGFHFRAPRKGCRGRRRCERPHASSLPLSWLETFRRGGEFRQPHHCQFFQLVRLFLLVPCVQSARSVRWHRDASYRQPHFLERPSGPTGRLLAALFHCTTRPASPPSIVVV